MRERARSSRSSPSTIRYPEPSLVTGNDEYSPSGTPYSPRESTAALPEGEHFDYCPLAPKLTPPATQIIDLMAALKEALEKL